MFRQMRRSGNGISCEETEAILRKATSGVLALRGDDGWPYAVPVSFVWSDGRIFFHCATGGHKLDAIAAEPRCSFCVIAKDEVLPEKFSTAYISVIAFGRARVLTKENEIRDALVLLADKYCPGNPRRDPYIASAMARLKVVEITVEHLSGKMGHFEKKARENT